MSNPDASDAARALSRARWGPPGSRELDRAVEVVVQRRAQLTPEQHAKLEAVRGGEHDAAGDR
jgi:hypothetical protein